MKLMRFGQQGTERPGLVDAVGNFRDLSAHVDDIDGRTLAPECLSLLRSIDPATLPVVPPETRLGSCIAMPSKILCIGVNYKSTLDSLGMPCPDVPAVAMKPPSAMGGPTDFLYLPPGSEATDWEVELGVVIGSLARNVAPEAAREFIAGYMLANDLAERNHQKSGGGDTVKGRGHDGFARFGPYLLTHDELETAEDVDLWLEIDGERLQSGNTADMLWPVDWLISHLSQFMTLLPGDVVLSGTPAGMGASLNPPRFLCGGETIRLGGTGLGEQKYQTRRPDRAS